MIRVTSPLDEQTEKYVKETIDCGYAVHKLPVGLLMNFGGARLKEGFRRIIL
jgi:hypothetical protein